MRSVFIIVLFFSIYSPACLLAQATDKVDADSILHETLRNNIITENWHEPMIISASMLKPTSEKGLFIVEGTNFQINSLRSDYYVVKGENIWTPVYDYRYPLETTVNLLLNRINKNSHKMDIKHHLYGGKVKKLTIKMQNLYDLFSRNMKIYCNVTSLNEQEIKALVVFHHVRRNFIHMLRVKINRKELINPDSSFQVDMYTNIPQDNLKSIFRESCK